MPRVPNKRLTDSPEATPEHTAAVVAAIEAVAPQPAPTPRPVAAPKPVTPAHLVKDGRGAFVFTRTGDHAGEYLWNPTAPAIEPTPLPLSSDIVGLLRIVAANNGLDKQAFLDFCRSRTQEVRAACREHRDNGGQRTAFDGLVAAFREQSSS